MINYSFIIPHKNCPDLLQRCVDSIPERDDVQIIVVDDNSNEGKKPQISRKGIEVILLDAEQSKGAGRARNVGLEHAKGKWLLFADCDDYYFDGFIDILDKYADEDVEVVYYDSIQLNFKGQEVFSYRNKMIQEYVKNESNLDEIKYRIHSPWNKMVKRLFVEYNGIQFEEVPNGNDIMFSFQVGYFAKKVKVISDRLYVYTLNQKSITHTRRSKERLLSYLCNLKKREVFCKFIGHDEWCKDICLKKQIINLLKRLRFDEAIRTLVIYFKNRNYINSISNKYVSVIMNNSKK